MTISIDRPATSRALEGVPATPDDALHMPRRLTSNEQIPRLAGHILRVLELLPDIEHNPSLTNHMLLGRLAADAYVLPPHYLLLRLHGDFTVHSNSPGRQLRPGTTIRQIARTRTGRLPHWYVAAHHVGLATHTSEDNHVHVATLAPDARTTTPVVIGMPAEMLADRLRLRDATADPLRPADLLDPLILLPAAGEAGGALPVRAPRE